MNDPRPSSSTADQRLEIAIGNLLRIGVILAASVVLVGAALSLFSTPASPPGYHTFTPSTLSWSIPAVLRSALHGNSMAILQLGILLLIATPIARVVFAAAGFAVERDRLYVAISLVVFVILIYRILHR